MRFKLPTQGMVRGGSSAYGIIAQKRRDSIVISQKIAEKLIKDGIVTSLWDEKSGHAAIFAICKQQELEHGEPAFVSATSIMIILRNLLKKEANSGDIGQ